MCRALLAMLMFAVPATAVAGDLLDSWSLDAVRVALEADGWVVSECWGEPGSGACEAERPGQTVKVSLLNALTTGDIDGYAFQRREGDHVVAVDVTEGAKLEALRDRFLPEGARISELGIEAVEAALMADGWELQSKIVDLGLPVADRWVRVNARAGAPTIDQLREALNAVPEGADDAMIEQQLAPLGWAIDSVRSRPKKTGEERGASFRVFLTFVHPDGSDLRFDWFTDFGPPGATSHEGVPSLRTVVQGAYGDDAVEYSSFTVQGPDATASRVLLGKLAPG